MKLTGTQTRAGSPRAVLVTGASSGIGAACAHDLERRGFRVFAAVRRPEDVRRLAARGSSSLVPLLLDVANAATIAAAKEQVEQAVGSTGLAGVVHSAGIVVAGPLELTPVERLRRQLEINVVGVVAVTQALLPSLRAAQGRIVNVGSISGRIASPYVGPYAASKHALEAISDAYRLECRRWNVSVSLIQAGSVKTAIWQKTLDEFTTRFAQLPEHLAALYREDLMAVEAAVERVSARAMPVDRVARAVAHALTSRRPRARYRVGIDARLGILLARFLPDRLRDWLVLRELGLR